MKNTHPIAFLLSIFSFSVQSQILDANSVRAIINNDGILFRTPGTQTAGYEIPKGSGLKAIYAASLWCSGMDENNQLRLAAMRYGINGNDFFPGPYSASNAYQNSVYQASYSNSSWTISKSAIVSHISGYNQPDYILPASIAN